MQAIFAYMDYRLFLKDLYEERKNANSLFSYRTMAGALKMDASQLAKIVMGQLHLSPKQIAGVCAYLHMSLSESQYFETLVLFGRAKTLEESRTWFEKLGQIRPAPFRCLTARQLDYYEDWRVPVVRALLPLWPGTPDWKALAHCLRPVATENEVRTAAEKLEQLGLLYKNSDGGYTPTNAHIGTGPMARSPHVRTFHKRMLELAIAALDQFSPEERDISAVTVAVDQAALEDIKTLVRDCRRAIQNRVNDVKGSANHVAQINFQVFPLSTPWEEYMPQEKEHA